MKKLIILISLVVFLISCDIMKKSSKTKSDIAFDENIKTETYRKGDTVFFEIPKIRYRDTVITTVSRQGTILNTIYDKDGNVSNECISAEIREWREEQRRYQESLKEKEKEKTEEFSSTWVLYIMIGLVAIAFIFIFFLFRSVNSNKAILNLIAAKLNDKTN